MTYNTFVALNIEEIRKQVLLDVDSCEKRNRPWIPSKKRISRQINYLIVTYISFYNTLGIAPYPDMLPHLGFPGQVLHVLFCQSPGLWKAFRTLVELSPFGLPRRTSLTEGEAVLHSVPERFVYRALLAMSGVTRVTLHPIIPGDSGRMRADFLIMAASGSAVYVELAMVSSSIAGGERSFIAEYRGRLERKLRLYQTENIDPVVIWGDQAAAPRALAERLNQIRAQLGLPTRPPAPLAWYEEIV